REPPGGCPAAERGDSVTCFSPPSETAARSEGAGAQSQTPPLVLVGALGNSPRRRRRREGEVTAAAVPPGEQASSPNPSQTSPSASLPSPLPSSLADWSEGQG
ncbi:hypothetical protein H1C71_020914, partial [Ictidomys tridecemlineatus]